MIGHNRTRPVFRVRPVFRCVPFSVAAGERSEGHFVVLAAREAGHIQMIDYPRYVAWVPAQRVAQLDSTWRGELILLQKPPKTWAPWRAAAFGASCAWMAIGLFLLCRQGFRRHARTLPMAKEATPVV